MTREEQFTLSIPEYYSDNDAFIYTIGAEWADEHPREGLWDKEKVCKYLKMVLETTDANYNETYIRSFQFNNVDELIEDLCKVMEKQQ